MKYTLTGSMEQTDRSFTLSLQGAVDSTPPEPEPPPEELIVITPTGGDDAGLIQGKLNDLPQGFALMLSGMFNVGSTLWLDGQEKQLIGDPYKQSGLRPIRAGLNGHYGALLCTTPDTARCRILGLEFDGGNLPVEMVFFDGGVDNTIEGCKLYDIASHPAGPPFAAIHSQSTVNLAVVGNTIERTGGVDGGEGVRGIWVPGRTGTRIERNVVRNTGHTGIAVEGATAIVSGNEVQDSLIQGTAYKICYRGSGVYRRRSVRSGAPPAIVFQSNHAENTVGAGLMLEDCGSVAVEVTGNAFVNCGREGTTFGGLYSSSWTNGLHAAFNEFRNCRSVGGFRQLHTSHFADNEIEGADVIYFEDDCHQIEMTNSGRANVGSNCSEITVDGQQVA